MGYLEFGFGMSRLFVWGAVCSYLVKRILVWFRGLVGTLRT